MYLHSVSVNNNRICAYCTVCLMLGLQAIEIYHERLFQSMG